MSQFDFMKMSCHRQANIDSLVNNRASLCCCLFERLRNYMVFYIGFYSYIGDVFLPEEAVAVSLRSLLEDMAVSVASYHILSVCV